MQPIATELDAGQVMTLEAFADTIIPGERRHADDRAIAGAADGGGAVASGAVELMVSAEGGIGGMLPSLVDGLDAHATGYAQRSGVPLDPAVPAFVGLPFEDRTALLANLMAPDGEQRMIWVSLAMFSVMAWDTGAALHTTDAIAAGHPGLTTMGFTPPDADGLWRFPRFSYGRALAAVHPHTTPLGDPQ